MTRALLDVNVLLALTWPNHQHHAAAQAWFGREGNQGWATCGLTQLSFIRLSSNPAFTPVSVTPRAAAALLQRLTAHAAHQYWPGLPEPVASVFERVMGHQQVMDAYLVHLAERHRGRLVTFDREATLHATAPDSVFVVAP
jgi:hypothetical protein